MLQGNAVIAQSGGPTAVINSSVCGAVQTWLAAENRPGTIYAAISGIKGFFGRTAGRGYRRPALDARRWFVLLPLQG